MTSSSGSRLEQTGDDREASAVDVVLASLVLDSDCPLPAALGAAGAVCDCRDDEPTTQAAHTPAAMLSLSMAPLPLSVDPASVAMDPGRAIHTQNTHSTPKLNAIPRGGAFEVLSKSAFFDVFGRLGVPMVATLALSALSTFLLAVIQVFPTETVNAAMNTESLDNGEFWLLPYPDRAIVVCATGLLVLFGIGYLWLVVLMLFGRRLPFVLCSNSSAPNTTTADAAAADAVVVQTQHGLQLPERLRKWLTRVRDLLRAIRHADLVTEPSRTDSLASTSSRTSSMARRKQSIVGVIRETTSHDGKYRQFYSAALDLPKLVFQSSTLITYLRHGFPTPLIYFYSHLLFVSWLATVYRYQRFQTDHRLIVTRLFYLFDLFFAVFAPLVVLAYAMYAFEFDRAVHSIKVAVLGKGAFDSVARMSGDPGQIATFRIAFHYLQFSSAGSLFVKSSLNLLSLYKWQKIITLLNAAEVQRRIKQRAAKRDDQAHAQQHQQQPLSPPPHHRGAEVSPSTSLHQRNDQAQVRDAACSDDARSKITPSDTTPAAKATARLRRLRTTTNNPTLALAAAFFVAGVVLFIYSLVALHSSTSLCAKYPKCSVVSYQWNVGADDCTCLVYVDRHVAPATFAEWVDPPDTSADLARLAVAGELRIVQIINRALPTMPEELRKCHELEQLILIYTKIQSVPDWAREFHKLEYLHIEGDFTPTQLTYLPPDLFSDMPHLTFLHLGCVPQVPAIPALSGLHHLRYLTIAVAHALHEVPSFDGLDELAALRIIDAAHVAQLPALTPLKKLTTVALTSRNAFCCNGFMNTPCNLTDFRCLPRADEELVTCTDARMSDADVAVLAAIDAAVCVPVDFDIKAVASTAYTSDTLCGGVKYKQCALGSTVGMCYNTRMQVIACTPDTGLINMRKQLIASGVGPKCDPTVEAWLGCVG